MRKPEIRLTLRVIYLLKQIQKLDFVKARKTMEKIWEKELPADWDFQWDYKEITFRELQEEEQQFLITLFEAIRLFDLRLYNKAIILSDKIELNRIIDFLLNNEFYVRD